MIVVMARVPEPGRAKTRLIPLLGEGGAARLCAAMTGDVFDLVRATGLPWKVALSGDTSHPWVRTIDVPVEPQAEGDLGARLAFALRGGGVAIGSDAPTLPPAFLREAHGSDADVVFAPAFDGGYVLVGTLDSSEIFDGIPWSTPRTFDASFRRAGELGRSVRILPFWYDVDEPDDVRFLARHVTTLAPSVAPRTRAFLEALEL